MTTMAMDAKRVALMLHAIIVADECSWRRKHLVIAGEVGYDR
jgi:hypothetical protein